MTTNTKSTKSTRSTKSTKSTKSTRSTKSTKSTAKYLPISYEVKFALERMGAIITVLNKAEEKLTQALQICLAEYPARSKEDNLKVTQAIFDKVYPVPQLQEAIGRWMGALGVKSKEGVVTYLPAPQNFDLKKLQAMKSILAFKPEKAPKAPKHLTAACARDYTVAQIKKLLKATQKAIREKTYDEESTKILSNAVDHINALIDFAKKQ